MDGWPLSKQIEEGKRGNIILLSFAKGLREIAVPEDKGQKQGDWGYSTKKIQEKRKKENKTYFLNW